MNGDRPVRFTMARESFSNYPRSAAWPLDKLPPLLTHLRILTMPQRGYMDK